MRRRPLLRAAVVGGGAYRMGQNRALAQQQEASQNQQISDLQAQVAAPPAAPAPGNAGISADTVQRLQQLGQLRDQGVLTDEEFTSQKLRLLGS